jgi:GT2 family glycosyltransferase
VCSLKKRSVDYIRPMISIIIVNFNSGEYLAKCLASIVNDPANKMGYEIIIVDNASIDDSIEQINKRYPATKIIKNQQNVGFSAANNQAIKISRGEYIMLLNHDTYVKPRAIKVLLEFMKNHPEAGACGPKILNADGTIQHQCKRGFPTPLSMLYYLSGLSKIWPQNTAFGRYLMTYLDPSKVNEVEALSGACMLIRRAVLDKIGGLDTAFFIHGEDIDYCYRIKQAGWKIFYVPEAEIIHYGGIGGKMVSYRGIIEFHRSMLIFYKKHYKKLYPFVVTVLVYFGVYAKMWLNLLINALRKDKFIGSRKPK